MKHKYTLNLGNKEIEDWLTSRTWIYHYSGNGRGLFAKFSSFDEEDWAEESEEFKIRNGEESGLPLYGNSFNTVDLVKEYQATYAFPVVHLTIGKSPLDDITQDVHIHFAHRRAGDDYEQVYKGYVQSLDELKTVFILLGVDEKYLS